MVRSLNEIGAYGFCLSFGVGFLRDQDIDVAAVRGSFPGRPEEATSKEASIVTPHRVSCIVSLNHYET